MIWRVYSRASQRATRTRTSQQPWQLLDHLVARRYLRLVQLEHLVLRTELDEGRKLRAVVGRPGGDRVGEIEIDRLAVFEVDREVAALLGRGTVGAGQRPAIEA